MKIEEEKEVCSGYDGHEDTIIEFFYLPCRGPQKKMETEYQSHFQHLGKQTNL